MEFPNALPYQTENSGGGRSGMNYEGSGKRSVASAPDRMIPVLSREQLQLRNVILLAHELQSVRSIVVTGVAEGVGATSVAATLALGLSIDQKKQVLLIDANVKQPRLHQLFRLRSSDELTSSSGPGMEMAEVSGLSNLHIIKSTVVTQGLAFDTKRVVAVMPALLEVFDFLIVDSPPIQQNPEILLLSLHLSGVIVVAEAGRTHTQEMHKIARELHGAKANLLGVVLNRQREKVPNLIRKWL
ncbi:MAG: CpsD/CapB family tyrosine-protein kinase [bacterium]